MMLDEIRGMRSAIKHGMVDIDLGEVRSLLGKCEMYIEDLHEILEHSRVDGSIIGTLLDRSYE